jgi:hypothetical protein
MWFLQLLSTWIAKTHCKEESLHAVYRVKYSRKINWIFYCNVNFFILKYVYLFFKYHYVKFGIIAKKYVNDNMPKSYQNLSFSFF